MQSDAFKSVLCFQQNSDFSVRSIPAGPTGSPRSQAHIMTTEKKKLWLLQPLNWAPDPYTTSAGWYSAASTTLRPPTSLKHPASACHYLTCSWDSWAFRTRRELRHYLVHSLLPDNLGIGRDLKDQNGIAANNKVGTRMWASWFLVQVTSVWTLKASLLGMVWDGNMATVQWSTLLTRWIRWWWGYFPTQTPHDWETPVFPIQ